MASFARKVLWIVTMNQGGEDRLLQHAQACGVNGAKPWGSTSLSFAV